LADSSLTPRAAMLCAALRNLSTISLQKIVLALPFSTAMIILDTNVLL
jgi:hypothetical protein